MTKNPDGKKGYSPVEIPMAAITALERELAEIGYGIVSLTIHIRNGRISRFTAGRECSYTVEAQGD
jgi:hypothetical protein